MVEHNEKIDNRAISDGLENDVVASDIERVNVVWTAVLVEGLFTVVAIGLSFLGIYDHDQPLVQLAKSLFGEWNGIRWLIFATLAAIPMIAGHWLIDKTRPKFYQPMQDLVEKFFFPMFAQSSWVELLVVSLAAGIGEELLFRWCIQGYLNQLLFGLAGAVIAAVFAVTISGVIFGLCHFVNRTYFVMATMAGIYLGVVMLVFDSWFVAAIAHAAFDFYALLMIKAMQPASRE
jgi:membrane protease YdiL (CAAX protease family)